MSNLSRLSQAVLHAHNELAYAKELVDKAELKSDGTGAIPQINNMVTCEFAFDDAVRALRKEEAARRSKL
jgi:hypothetical protein